VKPVAAAQTEDSTAVSRIISDSVQIHQNRLTDIGLPQRDLQTPFTEIVKDNAAQNAKIEILKGCEKVVAIVQGPVEWMMRQNMALLSRLALALRLRWA
jgi:sterigmatocystin 8-O-methyltransferase